MSHFSLGVIIKEEDIKDLENNQDMAFEDAVMMLVSNAMHPFDENKVSDEPELVFTIEELQEELDAIQNYNGDDEYELGLKDIYKNCTTIQEYCNLRYGYELMEDGAYSTYNQDSRWDWYIIGGRWNGALPIKGEEPISTEEVDSYQDDVPNNCCKIKDIEFRKEASEELIVELSKTYEKITTEGNIYKPEYNKKRYPTLETYLDDRLGFSTYALLTSDGEWVEPGRIGWFGMSSAEPEDEINFRKNYKELVLKENPEDYFVLVDCHI